MSEDINLKRAIEQLLEIDMFFADDLAIKGKVEQAINTSPAAAPIPAEPPLMAIVEETEMTKQQKLQTIANKINVCEKCQLSKTRQNPVPGEGDPDAKIVFVGEAPGADEDATGKPFVGRAGKLLTKIIEAMGLSREDVFICNTLKCRPPQNRDPQAAEKNSCKDYLKSQLQIINPQIIVALGTHAAHELLETDMPIGKLRGKFHEYKPTDQAEPIQLMPTYHPAYLLRNYSTDNRRRVWEDMQKVMEEAGIKPQKK